MEDYNLYFNNIYANNIDVFVSQTPSIPLTTEQYEEIQIEGRNGKLIRNKGTYADKQISIKFKIVKARENYYYKLDKVIDWLTNIKDNRLILGRDDRCLLVKKVVLGDITRENNLYGEFTVNFICKPFWYSLNNVTKTITKNNTNIFCKGNIDAELILEIYGNGDISITVNDTEMQLNIKEYAKIDSELMEITDKNNNNLINNIGDFPTLSQGKNNIMFDGDITKIVITYRELYR